MAEYVDEVHQDPDIKVTLEQFKSFLYEAGRSDQCPVCPHSGAWNFYVDNSQGVGTHAWMALTPMTSKYPGSPDDTYYVFTMDCPRCGFMIHTNSKTVIDWIDPQATINE